MTQEIVKDIVCQAFAGPKSKETIYSVLNEFLPNYRKLNLDYACKPDDPDYIFKSQIEMIDYFVDNQNLEQTFYWNKKDDNPNKITIGANITSDNFLIISLTIDGTLETGTLFLSRLKEFLNTEIGVITFVNPAEYCSGEEFKLKFKPEG